MDALFKNVIDKAVKIATKNALDGHPVESITWIPPQSASQNPIGVFAIKHYANNSASTTPPWME